MPKPRILLTLAFAGLLIPTGCDDASTSEPDPEDCLASEYRSEAGCVPLTICSAEQWQSTAPTATSDRGCTAVTVCSAEQWESTAPTRTSDRVCTAVTVCSSEQWQTTAPTATRDRACTALTVCSSSEWQSAAPTSTSDRVCSPITACAPGTTESVPPTSTSDRVCSTCGMDRYESGGSCHELTACDDDEWQSTAPTGTSDRACTTLTECTASQWQSAAPTATSDRICRAITRCQEDDWEVSPPTATSDRECRGISSCRPGTRLDRGATPTSDTVCAPCSPGEYCVGGFDPRIISCGYLDFDSDPATPCESLVQVELGPDAFGCLRGSSGQVLCWPSGNYITWGTPEEPFRAIDVGTSFTRTCALRTDGSLRCWNENGDLPDPTGLPPFVSIELASTGEICGLTAAGALSCWDGGRAVPADLGVVAEVASSEHHTCARLEGGTVRCWGITTAANVPSGIVDARSQAASENATCVVLGDGTVRCWGTSSLVPATPADLVDAVEVDVAAYHACALRAGGELRCWGSDLYGEMTPLPGLYASLSVGAYDTCGITVGGQLVCVGSIGALFGESTPEVRVPRTCATADEMRWTQVDCGAGHTITAVEFASYGTPSGTCATTLEESASCHASTSRAYVEGRCLGRSRCYMGAFDTFFGDPCDPTPKSLAVRVTCD